MTTVSTLRSVPEPAGDLDLYAARWRRHMKADNKAERTINDYLRVVSYFDEWLAANSRPRLARTNPSRSGIANDRRSGCGTPGSIVIGSSLRLRSPPIPR